MDEFFTPTEVADKFKVKRQTVYKWMKEGKLSYVFVGSDRRITKRAIDDFVRVSTEEAMREETQKNGPPRQLILSGIGVGL